VDLYLIAIGLVYCRFWVFWIDGFGGSGLAVVFCCLLCFALFGQFW